MASKHIQARRGRPNSSAADGDRIFGVHAARAAIANPARQVTTIYATTNGMSRIEDLLGKGSLKIVECSPAELTKRLGKESVHQGVLVEAAPLPSPDLGEIIVSAEDRQPLVVLDQVTDPHNVGAILRSAAAFGATALVMTRRNSPPLDGVLAKSASGAVEHVPVILVANLARALDDMGDAGVVRIGLDGSAAQALETTDLTGPIALVLGAEGKGLRRLTGEKCDQLCRLTTTGPLGSLNVSNAAAVALHSVTIQRQNASGRNV